MKPKVLSLQTTDMMNLFQYILVPGSLDIERTVDIKEVKWELFQAQNAEAVCARRISGNSDWANIARQVRGSDGTYAMQYVRKLLDWRGKSTMVFSTKLIGQPLLF